MYLNAEDKALELNSLKYFIIIDIKHNHLFKLFNKMAKNLFVTIVIEIYINLDKIFCFGYKITKCKKT